MKLALIALVFAAQPTVQADDWPAPVMREVFSPSRSCFVRVLPGKSFGDAFGFSSAPKGLFATAEFYRLERDRSYRLAASGALINPVAPMEFFVADSGVLITLDNWHNMGYSKVVAFYSAGGKLTRAYALSDLFTRSKIEGFRHSMSSIWWRKPAGAYVRPGDDGFYVTLDESGAGLGFKMDGTRLP